MSKQWMLCIIFLNFIGTICWAFVTYIGKYTYTYTMGQLNPDNIILPVIIIILAADIICLLGFIIKKTDKKWWAVILTITLLMGAGIYAMEKSSIYNSVTVHQPEIVSMSDSYITIKYNENEVELQCTSSELALLKALPETSEITFLEFKMDKKHTNRGILTEIAVH